MAKQRKPATRRFVVYSPNDNRAWGESERWGSIVPYDYDGATQAIKKSLLKGSGCIIYELVPVEGKP